MKELTKEQKQTLIDYMVKHCGHTPHNAKRRLQKWLSDQLKPRQVTKKDLVDGKSMNNNQIKTMVIYMHRNGFVNWWIAKSMGILESEVSTIITEYKKSIIG